MANSDLTQAEADTLMALEKRRMNDTSWDYPDFGGQISVPLISVDHREHFTLDLHRSRIALGKGTYQHRARQTIILARLDFGGAPHRNPDGEEMDSPHLHLYREGYGDKWAFPIPPERFTAIDDPWQTLEDFMRFCNIVEPPIIAKGLFT